MEQTLPSFNVLIEPMVSTEPAKIRDFESVGHRETLSVISSCGEIPSLYSTTLPASVCDTVLVKEKEILGATEAIPFENSIGSGGLWHLSSSAIDRRRTTLQTPYVCLDALANVSVESYGLGQLLTWIQRESFPDDISSSTSGISPDSAADGLMYPMDVPEAPAPAQMLADDNKADDDCFRL